MLEPTRYTKPLSEDFTSDADWLLPIAEVAFQVAYGKDYRFDEWQKWLVRRVLETDAKGNLRYRQCFVSLPRQNGKSEVGTILGLWSLLRSDGTTNLGIASTADQSRLIHERLLRLVQANPSLSKMMTKITDTRGIVTNTGTKYIIRASAASGLQGIPVTTAIVDELHLVEESSYSAVVSGMGARRNTLAFGITTAGDQDSTLLMNLYESAEKALKGEIKGFGAFIWEASSSTIPDDDDELLRLLMECNPSLEAGRLDPTIFLQDVRTLPPQEIIRYRLNRFIDSEDKTYMPLTLWQPCGRTVNDKFPHEGVRPVFAVDRTPDWGHATITASVKDKDGIIHFEIVASFVKPTLEQLVKACTKLMKHSPAMFAMDGYGLKELGQELKRRGMPTFIMSQPEIINASSLFYARTAQKKVRHANDPLMTIQLPRTARKTIGDAFRVSRKDSSVEIDAVMSHVIGAYVADVQQDRPLGVW